MRVSLTIAAEMKSVLENHVLSCINILEEAKIQLATANEDLKFYIAAAQKEGVDPTPYVE
jgi:hypothetical protein